MKKGGFLDKVKRQLEQGYRIVALHENKTIYALAGYRLLESMAWVQFLYVDDLVTKPRFEKKGYGSQLLEYLFDVAKENRCDQIHLDSGYPRKKALN